MVEFGLIRLSVYLSRVEVLVDSASMIEAATEKTKRTLNQKDAEDNFNHFSKPRQGRLRQNMF